MEDVTDRELIRELCGALRETKELLRFALLSTTPEIARDAMVFIRKAEAALSKAKTGGNDE